MRIKLNLLTLAVTSLLVCKSDLKAQIWGQYAYTVTAEGWVLADNGYHPMPGCLSIFPSPTENSFFANLMFANVWGHQLGLTQTRQESEDTGVLTCEVRPTYVDGYSAAWAFIDGINSSAVTITYGINPVVYCNPDASFNGIGSDTLDFSVILDVTNAPNGFPIQIYISWDHFGGISGPYGSERPPNFDEDECFTTAQLFINGVEQLMGRFDFADVAPGPPNFGWNRLQNQTSVINTFVGQSTQTIQVILIASARVQDPFPLTPGPFPTRLPDENSANQHGSIRLSLNAPNPLTPPDSQLTSSWMDFTVDIGGDAELSDTPSDGNEVFDPADIYVWHGPALPAGGADGTIDDIILYGFDIFPDPPDGPPPTTGVPVGSGVFTPNNYLDIDGHEMLNFDMNSFSYGPGQNPIGYFLSSCVHASDNLYISYDDDENINWSNPFSVATDSRSPFRGDIFGQAPPRRDEVLGLTVVTIGTGSPVAFEYSFQSEFELHTSLGPDPDYATEELDDDVDGIDIRDGQCNVWYFSVDHEASFGLDPGVVYQKVGGGPGGGFVSVVDPVTHLGLMNGVDIDAIEFCWIFSYALGGSGLALLFSVDDDDPNTPDTESSGLDPGMIYFSFLDGMSFPLLGSPLGEDIDALAAWESPLYTGYRNPQPCLPVSDLTVLLVAGNFQLNFTAPQAGTYTAYLSANPNQASPPPGPGWSNVGSITAAAAGQQMNMLHSPNPIANYGIYAVISTCP